MPIMPVQDHNVNVKNDIARFVWNRLAAITSAGPAKLASGQHFKNVQSFSLGNLYSSGSHKSGVENFICPSSSCGSEDLSSSQDWIGKQQKH